MGGRVEVIQKYKRLFVVVLMFFLCFQITGCYFTQNQYEIMLSKKYGIEMDATYMGNYEHALYACHPDGDESTPFILEKRKDGWADNYVVQSLIKEPLEEIKTALAQQGYLTTAVGTIVMIQKQGYDIDVDYWKTETDYQMSLDDFEEKYADRMYYYIDIYVKRSECLDKNDLKNIHNILKECTVGRRSEMQFFIAFMSDERFDEVTDYFQTEPYTFDYTRYSSKYLWDHQVPMGFCDGEFVPYSDYRTEEEALAMETELFQERRVWDDSLSIQRAVVR